MSRTDPERPWSILRRGAGRWVGEEVMPPAPWAPDGLEATGTTDARLVLDGRGLASDYRQAVGDETILTGHTVIRWDDEAGAFAMHFFSEPGGGPRVLRGRVEGDALIFEGDGPGGPMRQTFRYGDDTMEVRSEAPDGEDGWSATFEGRYRRVPGEAEGPPAVPGAIAWTDLTVDDAASLRDFYAAVVGWEPREVSMGDYADFNMLRADGKAAAGVCHARGPNASLPPVWLSYAVVDDLDRAVAATREGGGALVTPVRSMGADRMAVIRDPAGAVLALYEKGDG